MTRGSYAPLDRERHWITSWGTDHARSYAIDRALRPVVPALEVASQVRRGARGARHAYMGALEIGGRGPAGEPLQVVGQELWHSVADRQRAIAQLTTGFQALAGDLAAWQSANHDLATASSSAQWMAADVTPTLDEWHAFAEHESGSWWVRAATSWDAFEEWWSRLKRLRELARAHGITLQSVEPAPLPKTIWQRGAEGKGSEAAAWLGVLKIGIATAIGITGAVTLYTVLRDLRASAKPR